MKYSTASMNEGAAGTVAFGVGSAIVLKRNVVMSMDKRQAELQQSRSATQSYLIIERPIPSRLHLYTSNQAGFVSGSDHLTSQSRMALDDIATVMKRHADANVFIVDDSNTDVALTPTAQLAKHRDPKLAEQRALHHALTAAHYLQQQGIEAWRIKTGHADQKPAFKHGSSLLTTSANTAMVDLAAMLKRHPYASVDIIGHANDNSLAANNKKLSQQRAQTIGDYLQHSGMNPMRIHSSGTGKAAYHVAGRHHPTDAYRRVEIIVANRLLNLAKYTGLQEEEAVLFQSATRENLIVKRPALNKLNLILAHQASFAPGSAQLQPQAHAALKETVAMLKRYRSSAIHVIGHAKERNSATADLALSTRRARAVADFLQQQGIADVRVDSKGTGRSLYAATAYTNSADIFRRVEIMIEARHAI